jgi:hypothetical protein
MPGERFVVGRIRHGGWGVMCASRDTDCFFAVGEPDVTSEATGFERIATQESTEGTPEAQPFPDRTVSDHQPGIYEDEASEQRSMGSVSIRPDTWWFGTLSVLISDSSSALIALERHGPDNQVGMDAELVVPAAEMDALVTLLTGLRDQARRDGVLSTPNTSVLPDTQTD